MTILYRAKAMQEKIFARAKSDAELTEFDGDVFNLCTDIINAHHGACAMKEFLEPVPNTVSANAGASTIMMRKRQALVPVAGRITIPVEAVGSVFFDPIALDPLEHAANNGGSDEPVP